MVDVSQVVLNIRRDNPAADWTIESLEYGGVSNALGGDIHHKYIANCNWKTHGSQTSCILIPTSKNTMKGVKQQVEIAIRGAHSGAGHNRRTTNPWHKGVNRYQTQGHLQDGGAEAVAEQLLDVNAKCDAAGQMAVASLQTSSAAENKADQALTIALETKRK